MQPSRREFVKWITASGISLSLSRLALADATPFATHEILPGRQNWNPAVNGGGRVDGVAKVTGSKLYVSDFRAADMPGWPANTSHAILVRAPDATHVYTGMDLARLDGALKPSAVVTAGDIEKAGVRVPAFHAGALFCPPGTTPIYMGQPVALLLFEKFDAFDQARLKLRDGTFVKFGEETGPVELPRYGSFRFTRVAGATSDAADVYSPIMAGWVTPSQVQSSALPVWSSLSKDVGASYAKAATYGEQIRAELATNTALLVLDREFETQSVDPMFLEPEAGLGWYSRKTGKLELVLGVQSPYEDAEYIAFMLGETQPAFRPAQIDTHFAHVGGGFGGRDHSPFVLYAALAAMFFPDRPVRLAQDRYQQFQGGIKRHAFKIRSRIGIDPATARIAAFAADHVLDGGGLANYSSTVATVAATAAIGIYDIPKVDVTTTALHTRGVTAGSMRGYGTLQTMTALEVLIDEAARALPLDPIEFRRRNALKQDGRTMAGNPYIVSVRTTEILDKLERHPIWRQRAQEQSRAPQGVLVGTGIACVTKDYGSGADGSLSRVELTPDGRISIWSSYVEMGTGIGTALANRVAPVLGGVADQVAVSVLDAFDALDLVTSGDPYTMDQKTQNGAEKNPRWVPAIGTPSSGSIGAHVGTHSSAEAARVIFRYGLWPAALELWRIAANDPRAKQWDKARWKDGQLTMPGLMPLALPALAATAHARKLVTGAMTHGFSRWGWARARFPIGGEQYRAEIDALAIQKGGGNYARIDRVSVKMPPTHNNQSGNTYTSMCGTVVRVEITRATGALRIAKAYGVFECGQALVPEVVLGQAQGGFAMGVGYALLESLPPYEGGPGNGQWNLGQYLVARGSDLPLHDLEIEILPPLTPDEPPKGMAEVVMIPVVPAILNAIFDATGRRFQSLPVTQNMLKGVLA